MSASQRIVNAIVNTVHPRTAFDNETIKLRAKLIPRFFVRTSHCNFLPSSLLFLSFVREQQISQTISPGGPLAFNPANRWSYTLQIPLATRIGRSENRIMENFESRTNETLRAFNCVHLRQFPGVYIRKCSFVSFPFQSFDRYSLNWRR